MHLALATQLSRYRPAIAPDADSPVPARSTLAVHPAEELASLVARSLDRLWHKRGFVADTAAHEDAHKLNQSFDDAQAFPTATVEAFGALLIAVAVQPLWLPRPERHRLAARCPRLLELDPAVDDPTHPQLPDDDPAMELYRRAALFKALTRAVYWEPGTDHLDDDHRDSLTTFRGTARSKLRTQAEQLVTQTRTAFAQYGENDKVAHPFVCLRVLRALRMVQDEPWAEHRKASTDDTLSADAPEAVEAVWRALRPKCEQMLAQHQLRLTDASDAVALAFTAACASQVGTPGERYVDAAARACLESHALTAGWLGGRIIAREQAPAHTRRSLTVPGSEVFAALAEVLFGALERNGSVLGGHDSLRVAVERGLRLALDGFVETQDNDLIAGWAGEQVFGEHVVETWATASVMRLAIAAAGAADRETRQAVLVRYGAKPAWGPKWPKYLQWETYMRDSEPETEVGILDFLEREVVRPRKVEPHRSNGRSTVVLLFGPPGTTKTTIARAVANGLEWPLISLSPGTFIEHGLESIEQRAAEVFDDLQALSQTVVILDECEELFRIRAPGQSSDAARGVAAFMTASMLPKLQDLHDRGRIVLFICTNFLDDIDPAIRRVGRIDHIVAVAPPDQAQRQRIIELELKTDRPANKKKNLPSAIKALADETKDFIRGEVVAAARELGVTSFPSKAAAVSRAQAIAAREKDSITLRIQANKEPYEKFKQQREEISAPHRSQRQKPKTSS